MPNWCEGYLKIRGKKKDLINFIENEFVIAKSESVISGIEYIDIRMEDDGLGECRFEYESSYLKKIKLKNTRRFFIKSEELSFYYDEEDEGAICHITLWIEQAWAIIVQPLLVEHSQKYSLDFNLYASESGMEFEQYITIIDGRLVRYEEKKYNDFNFEAINPSLGG